MNYHSNALETVQWSLKIDLKKDLESFSVSRSDHMKDI